MQTLPLTVAIKAAQKAGINLVDFLPEDKPDVTQLAAQIHDTAIELMQMRKALDEAGVIPDADTNWPDEYDYSLAWHDAVKLHTGALA